ncbi:hypothetical protein MASR1M8_16810 [Thermomonas brevis]
MVAAILPAIVPAILVAALLLHRAALGLEVRDGIAFAAFVALLLGDAAGMGVVPGLLAVILRAALLEQALVGGLALRLLALQLHLPVGEALIGGLALQLLALGLRLALLGDALAGGVALHLLALELLLALHVLPRHALALEVAATLGLRPLGGALEIALRLRTLLRAFGALRLGALALFLARLAVVVVVAALGKGGRGGTGGEHQAEQCGGESLGGAKAGHVGSPWGATPIGAVACS